MSLNQMSLRDGETDEAQTRKFMQSVDQVIKDKLNKVRQYKRGLIDNSGDNSNMEEEEKGEKGEKKKKKITFA